MDEFGDTNLIGDMGAAFNSLAVAPDGTIYTINRDSGIYYLYTVDSATAETTQVGEVSTNGPWPGLAFDADGVLYATNEDDDTLHTINTTTGVPTQVGAYEISTYSYSISFDAEGTLWFVNGDGSIWTLDTTDGSETLVHGPDWYSDDLPDNAGDFHIRGGFNPDTGDWWGVGPAYGYVPASAVFSISFDADSASINGVVDVQSAPAIHMIAFPPSGN
jgi:hypothetical protein